MSKRVHSEFFVPEKAQNWPCARGFSSAVSTRIDHPWWRKSSDRSRVATYLASLAVQALIEEAELTPKPALADRRGSGAHTDLSLTLMKRSARSLRVSFERIARASFRRIPSQTLREELGLLGRSAERSMLWATGGVNTHRGAIWAVGLLVSAAAMGSTCAKEIAAGAGQVACLPDRFVPKRQSNGWRASRIYQVAGARGEAQTGFPHAITIGLPMLHRSRRQGASETKARLNALLAIMMSLNDTCLLHRGGLVALKTAQIGAATVLAAGGTTTARGWKLLQQLDRDLIAVNASPGGSADLLAATLFLDSMASSPSPFEVTARRFVSLTSNYHVTRFLTQTSC